MSDSTYNKYIKILMIICVVSGCGFFYGSIAYIVVPWNVFTHKISYYNLSMYNMTVLYAIIYFIFLLSMIFLLKINHKKYIAEEKLSVIKLKENFSKILKIYTYYTISCIVIVFSLRILMLLRKAVVPSL